MGIREEIEKIPIYASLDWPLHDRGVFCDGQRLMLAEVLRILDKWELVVEHTNEKREVVTWPAIVYPDDTIIIWRKKK